MSEQATLTPAERRLAGLLRVMAALLLAAAAVYALGPIVGPAQDFFAQPPFVSNSVVKVAILGLACLYAAGDVRRRMALVALVIAAHLVSVAAMASMLAFAETGHEVDIWLAEPTITTVLWGAIALDGLITAAIAICFWAAWRSARGFPGLEPASPASSRPERLLQGLLVALAVVFALAAAAYELGPFLGTSKEFFHELPFVTNSVVKVAALAMLCLYAAASLGSNMQVVGPVVAVHFLSVAVGLAYLIFLDTGYTLPLLGGEVEMTNVLWAAIALDGAIGALLLLAYRAAWKGRYGLTFLAPVQFRALVAAANAVVVGEERLVPAEQVAGRVEAFLKDFRADRRWLYRVALTAIQFAPLVEIVPRPRINPPLSELDRESRTRFLVDHYRRLPNQRALRFVKHLKQVIIRICQQLSYAGYYSDRRTFEVTGYRPFSERERFRELDLPEPGPHPLAVERPENVGVAELEAEICIIGSGAAGAILAHQLAAAGREVLILERGPYLEPRDFSEDEIEMIGTLYGDGLMQQTEDWRFTILQGSCIGGSTTVNNAVSFPPPDPVLARWNDPLLGDAGLDLDRLRSSVAAVERFLSVERQTRTPLNPSAGKYLEGVEALGLSEEELEVGVVRANISDCPGSGYCNIGCKWGKKLSMLETALPWAQRDYPGRVRILAGCKVERILTLSGSPSEAVGLRAKLADGRAVTVRASKYVLAAGAVASSHLLLTSGVGAGLPVGRRFSANMGAPLTAEFEQPMNAYDGLQISHYGIPRQNGFVFETWFNPPVSQALNMPGWFERHFRNMERYDHLMAVGVLVGTEANGHVRRALTGGPGVVFRPGPKDLATLARGLQLLGRILFAAGAKRVMVNTWGDEEFTSPEELGELERICADPDYIALGTGHPQGGNALSRDPKRGVVGPDFRVHGYSNLYVCDASVFPSSLTVNPQLTVMGLAHYAAAAIA